MSLSGEGNTAIVGGPDDNSVLGSIAGEGAAWAFTRSGGVWTQQGPKLVGPGALGPAEQGWALSLSGDGNTAIVGGVADNGFEGAAWVFVQPVFAGTPGKANCEGKSVSALVGQYHGLNTAAAALGFSRVGALEKAVLEFCEECRRTAHGDDCDEGYAPGACRRCR